MATSSTPDGANWFDEMITPEERAEVEHCVAEINKAMNVGAILAEALPDFIDARMGDGPRET